MQKPLKPEQRVGLLTLPLMDNYGGMLQIVALYNFLKDDGYDPVLFRTAPHRSRPQLAVATLLRHLPFHDIRGLRGRELARQLHAPFLEHYLPQMTPILRSKERLTAEVERQGLSDFIVGSDQVWRPEYAHGGDPLTYFLDFVGEEVAKISYAASFGSSRWQAGALTARVGQALGRFQTVTVREQSGVQICRETFGRKDAALVLDPTLLMPASFYEGMMPLTPGNDSRQVVMKYVLDETPVLEYLEAEALSRLETGAVAQAIRLEEGRNRATVGAWLRAFHDADFVVTDSFHGMVFSVIFQRQFVALINQERGADRFHTLAALLGLEDRLISSAGPARLPVDPIDYDAVAHRLAMHQDRSKTLLRQTLKTHKNIL